MSNTKPQTYFFCGVGGSGMSALALIFKKRGHNIIGSDRSYDQEKSVQKFKALETAGIKLVPQNGAGVTKDIDAFIVSSAIEDSIPDVAAAKKNNIPIRLRAELLAEAFNQNDLAISIAGTSGKSTVTGMVATALVECGLDPTVMNGGLIKNFDSNMRVGNASVFVTETDESDGSIALYNPSIAVLNNVALDHKTLEELDVLFGDFVARATRAVVLNFDDKKTKSFAAKAQVPVMSYAINDDAALLTASNIHFQPTTVSFDVHDKSESQVYSVTLNQPGAHNVSNALACLSVCKAAGVDITKAIEGLQSFSGIGRRFDIVGTKNDITVIDDFGHNPDKIEATLKTLKKFDGRVLVMFQPHGFGPLKLMGKDIANTFANNLGDHDMVFMPEPFYAGGTADRSVSSSDVVKMMTDQGCNAQCFATREDILPALQSNAQPCDRIVIMGARDDTLSDFAEQVLQGV